MKDTFLFKIGQAVKCINMDPDYGLSPDCLNKVGIITRIEPDYYYEYKQRFAVQFSGMIGDRSVWYFLEPHIIPISPEEAALFQEHKRREEYADRYL